MEEIFKDIQGYEGLYQVSNLGRVRSIPRYVNSSLKHQNRVLRNGKILKQSTNKQGYKYIVIKKNNKNKAMRVHRLVAQEFISNPLNLPQVNHKDGNKQNNCVDNLEWCTSSHNIKEAFRIGLHKTPDRCFKKGENAIPINQYDLDGNFIKRWDSITEASIMFKDFKKHPNATISYAIRKSKSKIAFGYIWKYTNK